jgi:competence protein ComFC
MLLDVLFPKTCVGCGKRGDYFCEECVLISSVVRQICPVCGKGSIGGLTHAGCRMRFGMDGLVSVFPYRGYIQDFVKRLKYRFVRDVGESAMRSVGFRFDRDLLGFFKKGEFVLVPVPLHPARERWRGFNQAQLLGKLLAKDWGLSCKELLLRVKNTDALAELKVWLSKEEAKDFEEKYASIVQRKMAEKRFLKKKKARVRRRQMRGAFEIVKGAGLPPSVLLVDDVWTSGSTMRESAKVLKRQGVSKVWGFTFARSGS